MSTKTTEWFDVVDNNDNVTGKRTRKDVHAQGLLHRAVHIHVISSQNEVIIQKRSQTKDMDPGKWTSACSGHVDSGEDYLEAAVRELKEELDISISNGSALTPLFKLPASGATGNEFICVYLYKYDGPTSPDSDEIAELGVLTPREIDDWMKKNPKDFSEAFRVIWTHSRSHF